MVLRFTDAKICKPAWAGGASAAIGNTAATAAIRNEWRICVPPREDISLTKLVLNQERD